MTEILNDYYLPVWVADKIFLLVLTIAILLSAAYYRWKGKA